MLWRFWRKNIKWSMKMLIERCLMLKLILIFFGFYAKKLPSLMMNYVYNFCLLLIVSNFINGRLENFFQIKMNYQNGLKLLILLHQKLVKKVVKIFLRKIKIANFLLKNVWKNVLQKLLVSINCERLRIK